MSFLAPLVKKVEVSCSVERAFEVFTRDIHTWWPLEGHSLGEGEVERIVFEEGVGGRVLERWKDGTERAWGVVSKWDPPHRVAFSWLPNPETHGETQIEVTFEPVTAGCVVTLEHGGWATDHPDIEERHASYDTGWDGVLSLYAKAARGQ